jgi:hypothetical protein
MKNAAAFQACTANFRNGKSESGAPGIARHGKDEQKQAEQCPAFRLSGN